MKVLVVHPYMKVYGGGEKVCLHIVKALIEEGHNVNLMCQPVKLSALESFLGANISRKNLYYMNMRAMPSAEFKPKMRIFSVYERMMRHTILKYCLKRKIGNIDIEFLTQDVALSCDIGEKKIAYVHFPNYSPRLDKAGYRSKLVWKIYYAPIEAYWKSKIDDVDLFLCNSEYTKNAIKERWGKEAIVVYPPVDIDRFKRAPSKEKFVVTIGRFVPEKNYEMVVEVAKLLPDVKFVIIGRKQDATYYEKIESIKPANLKLPPDLPENETISQLAKAKVYLHAMVGEHFGISIVEAMASGCIPVIHNSGGAKEIIEDVGYVYTSAQECSEAVRQALSSDLDPEILIDRARRFNAQRFEQQVTRAVQTLFPSKRHG